MPQVSPPQSDYRGAVGVRGPRELGSHLHSQALRATGEAIAEIAAEGDVLGRIESAGNTVAAVASGELPADEGELTLRAVPPRSVGVQRGSVTVDMEVLPRVNVTA